MSDETPKLGIKQWAADDRPREKLLAKGSESLSNAELIAILIGSGNSRESAVDLSQRILHSVDNDFNQLSKLRISDLCKFKGIGEAKAISIVAALEIGKRRQTALVYQRQQIKGSNDIYELFQPLLRDLPHEEFWILLLNRANKIIIKERLSIGGISGTVADIRLIFKRALESNASSLIVVHNHPSGNVQPSNEDRNITKRLHESGKLLDIQLLDHVIVTENGFFSFADNALL